MEFKKLFESPVGKVGRTSVKDAHAHISPALEKEFMGIVKKLGGITVAKVLINKIAVANVSTSDSNLKNYQDKNYIDSTKLKKIKESTESKALSHSSDAEKLLINKGIKIKRKFETKFGTEFELFNEPDEKKIKNILKLFKVSFDGKSVFVS